MIICTRYDLIYPPPMDVNSKPCTEFALQTPESWLWHESMLQVSYLLVSYLRKTQFKLRVESKYDLPFLPNHPLLGLTIRGRQINEFQTCLGSSQIQILLDLYSTDCKKKVETQTDKTRISIMWKL